MDWNLSTAARTLWQEARNQPLEGQKAVAAVICNRLASGRWGKTLFEVCTSEYHGIYQFSGWARNDPNRVPSCHLREDDPVLLGLAALVSAALAGAPDPTGKATHYYNPQAVAEPAWVKGDASKGAPPGTFCCQIGAHLFYRDVK